MSEEAHHHCHKIKKGLERKLMVFVYLFTIQCFNTIDGCIHNKSFISEARTIETLSQRNYPPETNNNTKQI